VAAAVVVDVVAAVDRRARSAGVGVKGSLSNVERLSPGSRYWPVVVHVDPPRLPDGSVDVRVLCRMWDEEANGRLA
jgi:hypothetical protein